MSAYARRLRLLILVALAHASLLLILCCGFQGKKSHQQPARPARVERKEAVEEDLAVTLEPEKPTPPAQPPEPRPPPPPPKEEKKPEPNTMAKEQPVIQATAKAPPKKETPEPPPPDIKVASQVPVNPPPKIEEKTKVETPPKQPPEAEKHLPPPPLTPPKEQKEEKAKPASPPATATEDKPKPIISPPPTGKNSLEKPQVVKAVAPPPISPTPVPSPPPTKTAPTPQDKQPNPKAGLPEKRESHDERFQRMVHEYQNRKGSYLPPLFLQYQSPNLHREALEYLGFLLVARPKTTKAFYFERKQGGNILKHSGACPYAGWSLDALPGDDSYFASLALREGVSLKNLELFYKPSTATSEAYLRGEELNAITEAGLKVSDVASVSGVLEKTAPSQYVLKITDITRL